ncbi:MAG: amidohydrolase family protein [Kibdelosporangium sp.]
MTRPFVIDGVCHPYNLAPDNLRGEFGKAFADIVWSFHPLVNPPHNSLPRQVWDRDWQPREFIDTMLVESDTDMVCVHALPIFDAFVDGFCAADKCAELKRRWPDRVIWYATADIFTGRQALDELRHQVTELGADGIKLFPAQYHHGRTRSWRMDDYTLAFPVFELARELGIRNVAVHKALPTGPVASDSMRVDDIERAAAAFPDLNFQIVHAGLMFVEETKVMLLNHPNVYATLENSFTNLLLNPVGFTSMLADFLSYGGPHKVIYSSGAINPHPRYLLEVFERFEMPEGFPVPLTEEVRAALLGGNLARLHGIDIDERRARIAGDEFDRERQERPREPWDTVRAAAAAEAAR